ncbi:probable G-protein coupled receptor 160 [Anarrhichthys ocellatus]|uniref:probable G-protein coupled receptor 160 n=1 Tax=Anarrhichthys ocellatus TaxID=433405 RepID=UPI0012ED69D0|nr:probable G-protein coupled receptor 160 [Anarrhichthys ocellatus]
MLDIVAQTDVSGRHTDNTDEYLGIMLIKVVLDIVVLSFSGRKLSTSFLSMCSLSIVLADSVMVLLFSSLLFLGPERYLMSLCFILANASAIYEALPLPLICLGLLDCCLEGTYLGKQSAFSKFLRHTALTLLVWILAVIWFGSVKLDSMKLDYQERLSVLVCEVRESTLINYFILGLFSAVGCTMLPFYSMIPKWVGEANRISEAREEPENQSSDLLFTSTDCTETKGIEENPPEETVYPRPPLWFSLILGFSLTWMPYLVMSVVCMLLSFGVPAYITVNLLWVECTNSFLTGVMFWANSNKQGPYSLPENVCPWPIYWHLSRGTRQQPFPAAVSNPSKEKSHTLLYV